MEYLHWIFSPLVFYMKWMLDLFHTMLGSYGGAIIFLSLSVKLLMMPIGRAAARLEAREQEKQSAMASAVASARASFKGRDRFERIEKIYSENNYHPIMSMGSLIPLFLQIPFLLSALFLLVDYEPLQGHPFWFLRDLSLPDSLAHVAGVPINVLPISLIFIALVDSGFKPGATRQAKLRFLIVSAVLVVLIYPMPAGVCLYWLSSNIWSLLMGLYQRATPMRKIVK